MFWLELRSSRPESGLAPRMAAPTLRSKTQLFLRILRALRQSRLFAGVLHEKINTEQRLRVASSPPADLPLRPEKFHIRMLAQVQNKLVGAAIELLWECEERLYSPSDVVSRAPDGNIEALLFDNSGNAQG